MKSLLLEPLDILFFRDGRPMAAGQGKGHGCRLPSPHILHSALRTALLYENNFQPGTGHYGSREKPSDRKFKERKGNVAFQSLRLRGPFLFGKRRRRVDESEVVYQGLARQIFLPLPRDVVIAGDHALQTLLLLNRGTEPPLKYLPVSPLASEPGKLKRFWTPLQFSAYLHRDLQCNYTPTPAEDLFQPERRIGVEIEPERQSAKEGQLYAASYFRPQPDTQFWFETDIADRCRQEESALLDRLKMVLLGGDQRMARIWNGGAAPTLDIARPNFIKRRCNRLKWVLLTPAIFLAGSEPGWWKETRRNIAPAERGPAYQVYLRGVTGKAEPVSQCLGAPEVITGYSVEAKEHEAHAKPTLLAVPAGSIYYFECDSPETAEHLAAALHMRHCSDRFGEKGYGLGVCGTWEEFPLPGSQNES